MSIPSRLGSSMNKLLIIAIALALGVPAPAHAQSIGERTGLNALTGVSPSTADFVRETAIGDMFETGSSELAAIRGDAPARAFAARMNEAHQKSSSELALLVRSHATGTTIPPTMDGNRQAMLTRLRGLMSDEFNRQYRDDQVSAHRDAVSLFQRYSEGGDNERLRTWARNMLPVLQEHLGMAQELAR
ncbi:DUF4142 domain-containing protein [Roseomonas nepalensis]|uniref:DUF4142 domain-containing protein n=2 Tax=Muricoccus nepalensis TaxID=1854500 RepID=A0A502G1S8_9PROT|nr:MAG: DUF4142 domain-containing protein [Acetobacteraceae bacterium]TPG55877.1 DUF4142 domain-containing protein [Roseomonas nepalensis]